MTVVVGAGQSPAERDSIIEPRSLSPVGSARRAARAATNCAMCLLKAYRILPFEPVDWVTKAPIVEKLSYSTHTGSAHSDVYRPASAGPHPGVVVSFGVVPFDVEHPQVPRVGQALARAGFAALLHWSPAMRDLRLDPLDIDDLVSAYQTLLDRCYVDAGRSGFFGTCIGGSFALMAAADPRIRDRIASVTVYAPYSSLWTFARDIASASRKLGDRREPWLVDPLTWSTFVRTLTNWLEPAEALRLRNAFQDRFHWNASRTVVVEAATPSNGDPGEFSEDAQAVLRVLTARDVDSADIALRLLPQSARARLTCMSPVEYVGNIKAPLVVLMHDRLDPVIPVSESRALRSALSGPANVRYTELGFRHLEPTKLSPLRLVRELPRSYLAMYPIFRQALGEARASPGSRRAHT